MPKKQTPTVAELRSMLNAQMRAGLRRQEKITVRVQRALNGHYEEDVAVVAGKKLITKHLSELIARRLKRNRRATPLFSSRDFKRLSPLVTEEMLKNVGDEFTHEELQVAERFIAVIFKFVADESLLMVPSQSETYEEYWRWIRTVLALADERGLPAAKLLALESARDEITRRMFTRKQFVALGKRAIDDSTNAEVFKQNFLEPLISAIKVNTRSSELREIKQEIEKEMVSPLHRNARKSKAAMNSFLDEEVQRIYGTKQRRLRA